MASKSGDSKQGLIIALVFCILVIIGLGVTAYYGFADQQRLTDAAKEAGNKEKAMTKDRDFYKYAALRLRGYIAAPGDKLEDSATMATPRAAIADPRTKDRTENRFQ